MHFFLDKFSRYICGVIGLLILFLPMSAFSAALSLEYSLGFNGYFQLESWTPLTVVLENLGRATRGTLEVIVTSGSEYLRNVHQTVYSLDVELPYNSKKLCAFTVLIKSFTHDVIIRLREGDQILLTETISLRAYYTAKQFCVVVEDKISPDFLSVLPQDLFAVNVRSGGLPETWYGYDSVRLLIINAEMLKSLRDRQFEALAEWVRQGGYLVTTGGINYGALLEQRTQRLLPIRIRGHQQVSVLPSLEPFCGQTLTSPDPFLVLQVTIPDSEILVQDHALPIIIQKTVGLGTILFLAVDFQNPPFSGWSGRETFWETILSLRPSVFDDSLAIHQQKILDTLLASLPADFPDLRVVLVFLVVYIALLWLCTQQIKNQRKQKQTYIMMFLGLIVIFSIASYGLFLYPTRKKNVTYNSFSQIQLVGQQKVASVQYLLGLYSIKKTAFNVRFKSDWYPITYMLSKTSDRKIPNPYNIHEDPVGQQLRGFSEQWSYNFFLLHTAINFPLLGQAQLDEHGLRLMIENLTPYTILDCRGYFDNRWFLLGDITPNAQQTKTITTSDIRNTPLFDEQQAEQITRSLYLTRPFSFLAAMQRNLTKDLLLAVYSKYQSQNDMLYMIGWIQSGIMTPDFSDPAIRGQDLTLVQWEIPVH